jgi:hypothetical protein
MALASQQQCSSTHVQAEADVRGQLVRCVWVQDVDDHEHLQSVVGHALVMRGCVLCFEHNNVPRSRPAAMPWSREAACRIHSQQPCPGDEVQCTAGRHHQDADALSCSMRASRNVRACCCRQQQPVTKPCSPPARSRGCPAWRCCPGQQPRTPATHGGGRIRICASALCTRPHQSMRHEGTGRGCMALSCHKLQQQPAARLTPPPPSHTHTRSARF